MLGGFCTRHVLDLADLGTGEQSWNFDRQESVME
jgi:hypothetical protein